MSAIVVEKLSKCYQLQRQARSDTLRDALSHGARGLWRRLRQGKLEEESFWALRDLDFAVKTGEVVGIIGRNGAGKSTLLKILSRITEPTTGRIVLRGRVSSLLEVGTGFHPELSGRENIFLNGAILGMSRAEIRRKFDEIVAFAEVERFLDTPVKRYSSGMYVRLAFAVAAHLEPEILIVDEVLAVGDIQFQEKCLGKMHEVARTGRTVLFVSHSLPAVRSLCTQGLLLRQGSIAASGPVESVVRAYLEEFQAAAENRTEWSNPAVEGTKPRFARIGIGRTNRLKRGESLRIGIALGGEIPPHAVISLHIRDEGQQVVLHTSDEFARIPVTGPHRQVTLDTRALNVGRYAISLSLAIRNVTFLDQHDNVLNFTIEDPDFAVAGTSAADWKGLLAPDCAVWESGK